MTRFSKYAAWSGNWSGNRIEHLDYEYMISEMDFLEFIPCWFKSLIGNLRGEKIIGFCYVLFLSFLIFIINAKNINFLVNFNSKKIQLFVLKVRYYKNLFINN